MIKIAQTPACRVFLSRALIGLCGVVIFSILSAGMQETDSRSTYFAESCHFADLTNNENGGSSEGEPVFRPSVFEQVFKESPKTEIQISATHVPSLFKLLLSTPESAGKDFSPYRTGLPEAVFTSLKEYCKICSVSPHQPIFSSLLSLAGDIAINAP